MLQTRMVAITTEITCAVQCCGSGSASFREAGSGPDQSGKLGSDLHLSDKQDPDPLRGSFWSIGGSKSRKREWSDQFEMKYPDPHQRDADPQHCM